MFDEEKIAKHLEKNDIAIHELSIQIENLNRQVEALYDELKVSPQQIASYSEDPQNFTEENWNTLLAQRKALEEKLLRELSQIKNPLKAKKAFAERQVSPHWLFVR